MSVIICLRFTAVSGLPTAVEGPGTLETSLEPLRQKRHIPCKPYSRAQLVRKLNRLGNKPGASWYGGYNRRYMAITENEACKFPSLVTTVSGASPLNVSSIRHIPLRVPTKVDTLTSRANCRKATDAGLLRMCSACPAVTFLGHDRIPSYINEVTCGEATCASGMSGMCQNTVMHQQFLYKTGRCNPHTGYEELKPYTQAIRVCCECMLFPN